MKATRKLKGQALGGLSESAIAVIILVLVVSIGATILQTISTTQTGSLTTSNQTGGNSPFNITNNTALANFSIPAGFLDPTIVSGTITIRNVSSGDEIGALNFTLNGVIGFNLTDQSGYTGQQLDVLYDISSTRENADLNITRTGLGALQTYADFFSVIVVVIVFAVIIGLFALFTTRRPGGGSL